MTIPKKRTAILISGRGSNMRSLVEACQSPKFPAEVVLVLSNHANAEGVKWAKTNGLPALILEHSSYQDRIFFENDLQKMLEKSNVEIICLAGFMHLLSQNFVLQWKDKILNIHPSLLPAFKGLNTHQRVLNEGVKFTGCTVHIVEPAMDDGPILGQAIVPVLPEDTEDILATRVLAAEHRLYPKILELFAGGAIGIEGRKISFPFTINATEAWFYPPVETSKTKE